MPVRKRGQIIGHDNTDEAGKVDGTEQYDVGHRIIFTCQIGSACQHFVDPLHCGERFGPITLAKFGILRHHHSGGERVRVHPYLTDGVHQRELDSANPHVYFRDG